MAEGGASADDRAPEAAQDSQLALLFTTGKTQQTAAKGRAGVIILTLLNQSAEHLDLSARGG